MANYKVLIIDDAFFIRNLIKKAIAKKPATKNTFEVAGEAQDGRAGIDLCESLKPDIITVDFNIPTINGLDFAKYLKDASYVQKKNFKLFTANGEAEVTFLNEDGSRLRVSMGKLSFWSDDIPVTGERREVINEDMVLVEPEEWYKFLRSKGIDASQNDIIDFL